MPEKRLNKHMSNLFKTVEQEAFRAGITPRTRQSRDWFRRKVSNMSVNRRSLMREEEIILRNRGGVGGMYMFFYDPKTKDKLPYWDNFPFNHFCRRNQRRFLWIESSLSSYDIESKIFRWINGSN